VSTLASVRQWVGSELGSYFSGTANASGHSTSTLVDTQLVSSIDVDDRWVDYWLILPAAAAADNRVSRVVKTFTPSTGTLTVDRVWSASTIPDLAAFELHGHIEPITELGTCINDALQRIMLLVEVTVTPSADAIRHDLTTANTWLTNPRWVRQAGYLVTGETRANNDPFWNRRVPGYCTKESGIVYLNTPTRTFASNETLYLRILKPAYAHCRTATGSGTYGEKTDGLTAEANESELDERIIGWGAINQAVRRELLAVDQESNERLLRKVDESAKSFTRWIRENDPTTREDGRLTLRRPMIRMGSTYAGYR
jgi:hypothetical protein